MLFSVDLKMTYNSIKKVFISLLLLVSSFCLSISADNVEPNNNIRQLKVITSGGFASAYNLLKVEFEQKTGIKLTTSYGSSSGGAFDSIPERLARGEMFDVIILSRPSLERLTTKGYVQPGSQRDLARSLIGLAVREGATIPDISNKKSFIKTLLDAESIGYSASASGTYLSSKLWPELGIWKAIKAKSKRISSERVASVVVRGEVQIGFQQVSEILSIKGVRFVGTIPQALQKITVFSSAILRRAEHFSDAKKLLDFLFSHRSSKTIILTGLEPVSRN